ncbi:23S rRNA-intervening sequence protein [Sulfuritortus calidifontis]|uniref:23S rRNA-intervening sequence protein n=2 Tax=Sulfuritortus calidifontis TaxID=1914471 RepID=A0A4R3JVR8_9PROT|nr:23S rRNA-intervening sequence protein [Sulfuritortus calidifontis]
MSHGMTGHDASDAPTRVASEAYEDRLPQAYVELLTLLEDMDVYVHQITQHWPKVERHGLAADVRAQMTVLHRLVAVAWKRRSKAGALFDLDVEVHVLKTLIRKAYRLGYINAHRMEVWSRHAAELGRRVGAWLRHESAKTKGSGL